MKKRAMKKYIPRDTDYCYDCKNVIFDRVRDTFITIPKEMGSNEYIDKACKEIIYRCRYTGHTTANDFCLYDGCKCCCVGYPKE